MHGWPQKPHSLGCQAKTASWEGAQASNSRVCGKFFVTPDHGHQNQGYYCRPEPNHNWSCTPYFLRELSTISLSYCSNKACHLLPRLRLEVWVCLIDGAQICYFSSVGSWEMPKSKLHLCGQTGQNGGETSPLLLWCSFCGGEVIQMKMKHFWCWEGRWQPAAQLFSQRERLWPVFSLLEISAFERFGSSILQSICFPKLAEVRGKSKNTLKDV